MSQRRRATRWEPGPRKLWADFKVTVTVTVTVCFFSETQFFCFRLGFVLCNPAVINTHIDIGSIGSLPFTLTLTLAVPTSPALTLLGTQVTGPVHGHRPGPAAAGQSSLAQCHMVECLF